ncbi:hypothetical protein P9112_009648 [Eukaryota sp. TZLM1-RC]
MSPSPDTIRGSWKVPPGTTTDLRLFNSLTKRLDNIVVPQCGYLRWYQCGPTVYDDSHMGHARTYVACDIIRRVIEDYFHIPISVVMNITDIDDKIILKSTSTNQSFSAISSKYEAEFFSDMDALHVKPPHVITRVSEYIPEIISFITRIIDKGHAYESNGSVYFSVSSYLSSSHYYGKLEPESVGDAGLVSEAEGALSSSLGKRSPVDFALWKAANPDSNPNEPCWDSPWGKGRPGWHIECSAMATEIHGEVLDIHLGGEDLRFPHHDNELAQSESALGCSQWCNYFVHMGTLKIQGQKMSKSLKNFTTIKEGLTQFSPRQVRLFFVAHPWNKKIDWSSEAMAQVVVMDKQFSNVFANISAALRRDQTNRTGVQMKISDVENELLVKFLATKAQVHQNLCENIATHEVISNLLKLVHSLNVVLNSKDCELVSHQFFNEILSYYGEILGIFGLNYQTTFGDQSNDVIGTEQLLSIIADFRGKVRSAVLAGESSQNLVKICDELRDLTMTPLGFLLEDRDDGSCVWKTVDPEQVRKEEERKKKEEERKVKVREAALRKEAEKAEKAKIPPSEIFKQDGKYLNFDENGIPTHLADGQELTKSARKKLVKQYEQQRKLHENWLKNNC